MRTVKLFCICLSVFLLLPNQHSTMSLYTDSETAWKNAVWLLQLTSCEAVIANSFPESDANTVSSLPPLFVIKRQTGNQLVLGT